jgi:hypothetical protein
MKLLLFGLIFIVLFHPRAVNAQSAYYFATGPTFNFGYQSTPTSGSGSITNAGTDSVGIGHGSAAAGFGYVSTTASAQYSRTGGSDGNNIGVSSSAESEINSLYLTGPDNGPINITISFSVQLLKSTSATGSDAAAYGDGSAGGNFSVSFASGASGQFGEETIGNSAGPSTNDYLHMGIFTSGTYSLTGSLPANSSFGIILQAGASASGSGSVSGGALSGSGSSAVSVSLSPDFLTLPAGYHVSWTSPDGVPEPDVNAIYIPQLGDVNNDGHVNTADISALENALVDLQDYGPTHNLTSADVKFICDVNRDGSINNADLQSLLNLLKSGGGSANSVPEPSTLALLTLGGVIGVAVKRRQG